MADKKDVIEVAQAEITLHHETVQVRKDLMLPMVGLMQKFFKSVTRANSPMIGGKLLEVSLDGFSKQEWNTLVSLVNSMGHDVAEREDIEKRDKAIAARDVEILTTHKDEIVKALLPAELRPDPKGWNAGTCELCGVRTFGRRCAKCSGEPNGEI